MHQTPAKRKERVKFLSKAEKTYRHLVYFQCGWMYTLTRRLISIPLARYSLTLTLLMVPRVFLEQLRLN